MTVTAIEVTASTSTNKSALTERFEVTDVAMVDVPEQVELNPSGHATRMTKSWKRRHQTPSGEEQVRSLSGRCCLHDGTKTTKENPTRDTHINKMTKLD